MLLKKRENERKCNTFIRQKDNSTQVEVDTDNRHIIPMKSQGFLELSSEGCQRISRAYNSEPKQRNPTNPQIPIGIVWNVFWESNPTNIKSPVFRGNTAITQNTQ